MSSVVGPIIFARDLMTAKPIVLESSTTIQEASAIFQKKKISSIPVVTTMGEVAGQLTELVMVRVVVMSQIQPEKFTKLVNCMDYFEPAVFVDPGDNIAAVIRAILSSPSRRVLVRSEGRRIQGIISPKDLLRLLLSDDAQAKSVQAEIEQLNKI